VPTIAYERDEEAQSNEVKQARELLAAIVNPTRLAILLLLARSQGEELSYDAICRRLKLYGIKERKSIQYHLKILANSELVSYNATRKSYKLTRKGERLADFIVEVLLREKVRKDVIVIDEQVREKILSVENISYYLEREFDIPSEFVDDVTKRIERLIQGANLQKISKLRLFYETLHVLKEKGILDKWLEGHCFLLLTPGMIEEASKEQPRIGRKRSWMMVTFNFMNIIGLHVVYPLLPKSLRTYLKEGTIVLSFPHLFLIRRPESATLTIDHMSEKRNWEEHVSSLESIFTRALDYAAGSVLIKGVERFFEVSAKNEESARLLAQVLFSKRLHENKSGFTIGLVFSLNENAGDILSGLDRVIDSLSIPQVSMSTALFLQFNREIMRDDSLCVQFSSIIRKLIAKTIPFLIIPRESQTFLADSFGRISFKGSISSIITTLAIDLGCLSEEKSDEDDFLESIIGILNDFYASRLLRYNTEMGEAIVFSFFGLKRALKNILGKVTKSSALTYYRKFFMEVNSLCQEKDMLTVLSLIFPDPQIFSIYGSVSSRDREVGPFFSSFSSYFEGLSLRDRIIYDNIFLENTGVSTILNLYFREALVSEAELGRLLRFILRRDVKVPFSIAYEYTFCDFCRTIHYGLRNVCPACMHGEGVLRQVGKFLVRYEDLTEVPRWLLEKYYKKQSYPFIGGL